MMMRLPRVRVRTYMVLVAVVAVLCSAAPLGWRSYVFYRRATIYSFQERTWREMAERDLREGNTRSVAAQWGVKTADHYAPLVRKYRRAMWRPWIAVDEEPPYFYPAGEPPAGATPQPSGKP